MTYIIRFLFWMIDSVLAMFIRLLYGIIFDMGSARILQDYIYEFMGRIYTFLAIFMVFKLSISVVNYILNPDQMTDKSKGFGKIIQNIIIVIGLIIMTPQLFDWAYKFQCVVLNSGVLNTLITFNENTISSESVRKSCFGDEDQCIEITKSKSEVSYMLTYTLYSSFVYKKNGSDDTISPSLSDDDYAINSSGQQCSVAQLGDYSSANDCIFNLSTVTNKKNEYLVLASTACLGFTCYILLLFAFDIGIRTVRLCFLQLVAPIPIISMLDPKKGKDGMFSKWLSDCGKTYAVLFIRLAIVYFISEIISSVIKDGITTASGCPISTWAKLFIILGTFAFAKQLPKFIEDLTGIKMGGEGLSLKKRLDNVPGLNRTLGAAKGLATGAVIGGVGAATGAGALRGLSGAWQGMRAGMQGKKINEIRKGQVDTNKKMRNAIQDGSTFGGRMSAGWSNFWGTPGQLGHIESTEHSIDEEIKDLDNKMANDKRIASQRKQLADNIASQENRAKEKIKSGEAGTLSTEYLSKEAHIESLKAQLSDAATKGDSEEIKKNIEKLEHDIAQAQVDLNDYLNNTAVNDYIDKYKDPVIENLVNDYNEIVKLQGLAQFSTASDRHKQMGKAKGEITEIETKNRPYEDRKSVLENQKKDNYDKKRTASANENAIK